METIKGIESGRAKFAYESANSVNDSLKKEYKSHVKSFPMMIKTNGLGASIAFLFSKKGKGVYDKIGEHIVAWLKKEDKYKIFKLHNLTTLQSLTEEIIKIDSAEYRALTVEILAFFTWLRRFAEGLCEEQKGA